MIDLGICLTWVAISAVSLKWLAAFGQAPAGDQGEPDRPLCEDELAHDELYSHELFLLPAGARR